MTFDPDDSAGRATGVAMPSSPRGLPEGHRMPFGYENRADGVFRVVPQTDKQGNPLPDKLIRVSYGPLMVTTRYVSPDGEEWYDLGWFDGRRPVVRRVDGVTVRSGRAVIHALGNAGIPAFDANARQVEQYLAAYLMDNGEAIRERAVPVARYLGWQADGTFVTADRRPWPVEPGEEEQRPILAAFGPSGTLAGWQDAVRPLKRYPVVRIALAAGFAAPLLRLLNLRSATLDISGRSTRGKSTTAAIAMSPWADPSADARAMGTWKAGIIMIEKRLNLVRGLPSWLDETRVVKSPDVVDQIMYQVPFDQGASRGGGWSNGLPWNTILISTGEQPALSFSSHEGSAARVLSLRRPPFGLDGDRSATDANTATDGIAEHHGVAGPAFAARLVEELAKSDGAEQLRKRHQVLAEAHAAAAPNDVARRRTKHIAALHLAAELAHEWDIVPFGALEPAKWTELLGEEAAREDRGGMALEIVRGLIAAQGHRIQPLNTADGHKVPAPAGGWIGSYVDHKGTPGIALLPVEVSKALQQATPPIVLDAVQEAWAEAGTIIMDGTRLGRDYINGTRLRCHIFPLTVLDGEPDREQEQTGQEPDGTEAADEASPPPAQEPLSEQADWGWPTGTYGAAANT